MAENTNTERAYVDADRAARAPADSVTAPAGGADWQDISTAPKDGTRFVAVGQNYGLDSEAQHTCIAQWLAGCWVEVSDWNGASKLKYLTHWMPLPPLPCSATRKQGATVTTPELLSLMRLLSAMESAMLASKIVFPDYLSDEVTRHTEILEREILARSKP